MMRVIGIIPARFASSRLPGKPLEMIGNQSLIMRVYNQCQKVKGFQKTIVATDDQRIFDHVLENGGEVIMTSTDHGSGTERCFEAVSKLDGDFDFIVNVQGDEPFINPQHIEALISALSEDTQIATLCMRIKNDEEVFDVNIPKVVRSLSHKALYFSRSVIPHFRKDQISEIDSPEYFKHIGIYAYKRDVLATIIGLPASSMERMEGLEQLRWLYNDLSISTVLIPSESSISVDTPSDLEKAREFIKK